MKCPHCDTSVKFFAMAATEFLWPIKDRRVNFEEKCTESVFDLCGIVCVKCGRRWFVDPDCRDSLPEICLGEEAGIFPNSS